MAEKTINAKELRTSLPKIVSRLRKGDRYTVLYRSRPAFRLVPVEDSAAAEGPLDDEPLYGAPALGRSTDGADSADHDRFLYGDE
jgi:antitoxin (DNA-binding transcriptional repressor) of toxin-antitoxin stability system